MGRSEALLLMAIAVGVHGCASAPTNHAEVMAELVTAFDHLAIVIADVTDASDADQAVASIDNSMARIENLKHRFRELGPLPSEDAQRLREFHADQLAFIAQRLNGDLVRISADPVLRERLRPSLDSFVEMLLDS